MMYVHYKDCDPLSNGKIKRSDQILVYYVMEIAESIPGLPGLFVAGVFSAALSSMSALLNTLSGTIYQDFVAPLISLNTSEARASNIMKLIVIIIGIISVILVFAVEKLGSVLQVSISISSITVGPMLGLFTLGMVFPWANAKGALLGGISSLTFLIFIIVGAQIHIAVGNITFPKLPLSTEACSVHNSSLITLLNSTVLPESELEDNNVFALFRVSFYFYCLIGVLTVLFVGLLVSWITGWQDLTKLDPKLITPVMQKYLPEKLKQQYPNDYCSVDQALENLKINS